MKLAPIPLVDLTRQAKGLDSELNRALHRVIQSGRFILGKEVACFEKEFARFCDTRFAVGVASGTDALELSLRALGIGPGDWVATVSFTFLATADAILHVGASPLFADIDPKTYTMDPIDLELRLKGLGGRVRRQVKAVVPVHLFGHPCDMDAIGSIAKRYRLAVVEDAAQAVGARWHGKPVGGLGTLGCFSFFPSKNLGAFGDGGMVVTSSPGLEQRLRDLRVHGRKQRLRQLLLGRNSRLDELQAAILRIKLKHLSEWIKKRGSLAMEYSQQLAQVDGVRCPEAISGGRHAFHLYVIRTPRREELRGVLREHGIASEVYYPIPVHQQPIYRGLFRGLSLPETERAAQEVLALPLFPELRRQELNRVCRTILHWAERR